MRSGDCSRRRCGPAARSCSPARPAWARRVVGAALAPVLLTITTGRPSPDAVTAMWKDGWATRVELQPLARGETDELVSALLGGPCAPLLTHEIWETSQGNALVINELVHAGL